MSLMIPASLPVILGFPVRGRCNENRSPPDPAAVGLLPVLVRHRGERGLRHHRHDETRPVTASFWVTIYDLAKTQHLDWGWVAPHTLREWTSAELRVAAASTTCAMR